MCQECNEWPKIYWSLLQKTLVLRLRVSRGIRSGGPLSMSYSSCSLQWQHDTAQIANNPPGQTIGTQTQSFVS